MQIKKLWFWVIAACFFLTTLWAVQTADAFTIQPNGWMTATAQFKKDSCGWSGVKPDYCPTQTPKPIQQLTQEFLEFCKSSPYQLQPGCPYEPTVTQQPPSPETYPGPIDDCDTATYPGPDCSIFSEAEVAEPITLDQYEPAPESTPTATRWLISRPTNRKPRR